jgi:DNA-3-methyladenine glycosylase II
LEAIQTFNELNLKSIFDILTKKDADLKRIIHQYGYPPFWNRKPNFETLVHIILEQQVSLASAKAALNKLKEKIGTVAPNKILLLTDEELRACYFSRQKILYVRQLAQPIVSKQLNLSQLKNLPDDIAKAALKNIKGIGDWTAEVYLMMALQRADLFPAGDIGLVISIKEQKKLLENPSRQEILLMAEKWKPYRTLAAYILWHGYLSKRKRQNH